MDPVLDPPPLPDQLTAAVPDADTANPVPAQNYAHKHPPYAEMITAAISALMEPNGSSKRAIAKYIGDHYSDLPSTHEALLTHHLKRLKINGQLLMVKHSYKLPRSAPPPPNGAVNAVAPQPSPAGPKKRPGRPPKHKPEAAQVAVPVFQPMENTNSVPAMAAEPVNGPAAAVPKPVRGRGRPPKLHGLKRPPGRPPKAGGPSVGGSGRGRGRPRLGAPPAQVRKRPGRPPKLINVIPGSGIPVAAPDVVGVGVPPAVSSGVGPVKRGRGRPPKAGGVAKRARDLSALRPRKLSGKPVGRPRKNASGGAVNRGVDSQLLLAYLDLKAKLENLQARISQTANIIKPYLNNEASINALQELELIAANMIVPHPQTLPQPQVQPQPQPPLPPEQYPQQPQN
ncbi:HMR1 protein [Striga asiatica]|uniref:HMR1 protein n=1 Tax=Striga asiatica TaxID=4170 RepID=A0A5A7PJ50_STRAF|nr:HMR1 protein [Striga asiatica]